MRAVVYDEYGGPSVLHLADDVPEPHAGPGEVRIRVQAASLNPFDGKVRSGSMASMMDVSLPHVPGLDGSGVVDEVGEGVTDVTLGDRVLGLGQGLFAEHAVLSAWAPVPDPVSPTDAASLPTAVETAARCLDLLGLTPGQVIVLDGASGGVGTAAVQLAVIRGLVVVATASAANQDYLADLGARPTTYGPGLADRVRGLLVDQGDGTVAGALDLAGRGGVPDLVELTGDPARVVTIADFAAGSLGVQVTGGGGDVRAVYALGEAVGLLAAGQWSTEVTVLPWTDVVAATEAGETGHARGKTVLAVAD